MFGRKKLKGRKIAVLAADGFERVELSVPVKALRAAGARVDIVSVHDGKIRGVDLLAPSKKVRVDRTLAEVEPSAYDALFIPGGFASPDFLRQSWEARELVRSFDNHRKPIASLCHGPWMLASAELATGRRVTSWPGIRDDLVHAGAVWHDEEVVRDANWVTSRGPEDLGPFVRAMLDLFAERAPLPEAIPSQALSSPRRDAPPAAAVRGAKAVSAATTAARVFGVAAALAIAGVAAIAVRNAIVEG